LRSLVKKVNTDYLEDIEFEKEKGEKLNNELKSLEAALRTAMEPENNSAEVAEFWGSHC
jgi:hypothetical protein